MGSGSVTTATERFKSLFANTVERVCVLEEQLELAKAEIERLKKGDSNEELDNQ